MQTIYQDVKQAERLEMLKANCRASDTQFVKVYFSDNDLEEMRANLSELAIIKNDQEEELKELSRDLKKSIKTQNEKIKSILRFLKDKYDLQEQEVYEFDDQENKLMLTYNAEGVLINSRPLRPAERQTTLLNINKTA